MKILAFDMMFFIQERKLLCMYFRVGGAIEIPPPPPDLFQAYLPNYGKQFEINGIKTCNLHGHHGDNAMKKS